MDDPLLGRVVRARLLGAIALEGFQIFGLRRAEDLAELGRRVLALHPFGRVVDLAQVDAPIRLDDDPVTVVDGNLARIGEVFPAATFEDDLDQLAFGRPALQR